MGYDSKGIMVFNLKYEHAISFINLVKFIGNDFTGINIKSDIFTACTKQHFQCVSNLRCIPKRKRCDNKRNCRDGSDEANCKLNGH